MISALISLYAPGYLATLVFMLQSVEYEVGPYLKWYWRTVNFRHVAKRRQLDRTKSARLLLLALRLGVLAQLAFGVYLIWQGWFGHISGGIQLGAAVIIIYPVVWAHLVVLPLWLGRLLIYKPRSRTKIHRSKQLFRAHKAVKIAVAGSYGKTSMKEILATVLAEGKKVAATPANKNVSLSHAQFAAKLAGDEDVIIIEYGEGRPGDVKRFAKITQPTHAIITGVAPAHLDKYKTVQAAGLDIFAVANYLKDQNTFVNGESPDAQPFIKPTHQVYGSNGLGEWQVKNVKISDKATRFTLKKDARSFDLRSGLLGRHQIGPLVAASVIADQLGLTKKQIEAGVAKTVAYEHRLQPYELNGAMVLDDTYNGNLEGIRAGLALLAELKAKKRKLYVTPGLVDQGAKAAEIHKQIGELIAAAKPDQVVLMQNSVTDWIKEGLESAGYKGELRVESEPLQFYQNLGQFVAAGDVVLLQNDWTDNYA